MCYFNVFKNLFQYEKFSILSFKQLWKYDSATGCFLILTLCFQLQVDSGIPCTVVPDNVHTVSMVAVPSISIWSDNLRFWKIIHQNRQLS